MTLYAYVDKNNTIIETTVSTDRGRCYDSLWDHMTEDFREQHWKDAAKTKRSFKKLGYRLAKVRAVLVHEHRIWKP